MNCDAPAFFVFKEALGNLGWVAVRNLVFIAKHFELPRELAPGARRVAVLMNPSNDVARLRYAEEGPQAAARLGMQVQMLEVRDPAEIAPAIETAARRGAGEFNRIHRSPVAPVSRG